MLKSLLKEPLVHFAALAALIFAAHAALAPASVGVRPESIVIGAAKVEQLRDLFFQTWQRPPSPEELRGLIDDQVTEEIYVREALKLGLDRDDTVIRRRLRQKMEFLTDAEVGALSPTDAELESYLAAHPDAFSTPPRIAFQQVFFNPDRRGDVVERDSRVALASLIADPGAGPARFGDASLLPADMPLSSEREIAAVFGPDFATAAIAAKTDRWTGPVASAYGLHLIRVTARTSGQLPPLSQVRDAVLREWTNAKRQELEAARVAALQARYRVSIEAVPQSETTP